MSEPKIIIDLHNRTLLELRPWFDHEGFLLTVNGKQTAAGNDEESMRYVMERVLKAVRESAYRLVCPEEKLDE